MIPTAFAVHCCIDEQKTVLSCVCGGWERNKKVQLNRVAASFRVRGGRFNLVDKKKKKKRQRKRQENTGEFEWYKWKDVIIVRGIITTGNKLHWSDESLISLMIPSLERRRKRREEQVERKETNSSDCDRTLNYSCQGTVTLLHFESLLKAVMLYEEANNIDLNVCNPKPVNCILPLVRCNHAITWVCCVCAVCCLIYNCTFDAITWRRMRDVIE